MISYLPGSEWTYFKLYMGPASVDRWISECMPEVVNSIQKIDPEMTFFFVRYMDPDFHLRFRIHSTYSNMLYESLAIIKDSSANWIKSNSLWSIEMSTYQPELNRYDKQRIHEFEKAFHYDSVFWLKSLKRMWSNGQFETNRWQAALLAMFYTYTDFYADFGQALKQVDLITRQFENSLDLNKNFMYKLDQKYRNLRTELLALIQGDHPLYTLLNKDLRQRSDLVMQSFSHKPNDNQIADLTHMSMNRALRSKHRLQEFVLYHYLGKVLRSVQTFA